MNSLGELIKPIAPEVVGPGNSLGRGLLLGVPFSQLDQGNSTQARCWDHSPHRRHGTPIGTAFGYGRRGPLRSHITTGDRVDFGTSAFLPTQGVTIVLGYRKRDATVRAACAFGVFAATASTCGALLPYSDGKVYWDFGGNVEGTTRVSVAGLTVSPTQEEVWAFTAGRRGMEIWQDGRKRASNSANPTRTSAVPNFYIGLYSTGLSTSDLADYTALLVYDGQLDESTIRLLSADPWAPFRPAADDWGPAVAGGGATSIPVLMESYRRRRTG
jgi:hypothetical protein